jgi:hypothetical protein
MNKIFRNHIFWFRENVEFFEDEKTLKLHVKEIAELLNNSTHTTIYTGTLNLTELSVTIIIVSVSNSENCQATNQNVSKIIVDVCLHNFLFNFFNRNKHLHKINN